MVRYLTIIDPYQFYPVYQRSLRGLCTIKSISFSLIISYFSQYGFRNSHSTELTALEMVNRIIIDMDNNKLPINIYLDLSKAFDTLDHNILLHKLSYYGIRNKTYDLLKSYLCNHKQYVEFNDNRSSSFYHPYK